MIPDPELAHFIVTCHTTGCENADHALEVLAAAETPAVVCGPCGHPITDIQEAT